MLRLQDFLSGQFQAITSILILIFLIVQISLFIVAWGEIVICLSLKKCSECRGILPVL